MQKISILIVKSIISFLIITIKLEYNTRSLIEFHIFTKNNNSMFTKNDISQIEGKGLKLEDVELQINNFKKGFPYINLVGAATPTNGLHSYSDDKATELAKFFDDNYKDYDLLKFVPASGAASRMFKHLFEFMTSYTGSEADIAEYEKDKSFNSVFNFFNKIESFAFYTQLKDCLAADNHDLTKLIKEKNFKLVLEYFLTDKGLDYAAMPKGLLLFHDYPQSPRYAVEEHLVEAAVYSTDSDKKSKLHLTVSPDHESKFKTVVAEKSPKFETQFNVSYEIDFSEQMSHTDMIAVDLDNEAFRTDDGKLLFRPGGHGALIENLNRLESEIVFVKNIDNIVPDRLRDTTYTYKKVIGGLLFKLQIKSFDYLELLECANLDDEKIEEISQYAQKELNIFISPAFMAYEKMEKVDFLFNKLNRPMRICGMVKNEGEPGGGPFWVENKNGERSLQIVESSQMNLKDQKQIDIVSSATHFNPVDLVCGIKDFNGDKFDLKNFVDPETGFISIKSMGGRELKAQELPGLWNGAMADWITIFVETPIITFNPVKTVNDLLRDQHQPK